MLACAFFFLLIQAIVSKGQAMRSASTESGHSNDLRFDVVSIRASSPDARGLSVSGTANSFVAKNVTIGLLLENVFNLRADAISGIPASLENKRFDVVAKVLEGNAKAMEDLTGEQRQKMLEAVLRDRFALRTHRGTRTAQVYVLTQSGSRIKLQPSAAPTQPLRGIAPYGIVVSTGHLEAHAIPIASLIGALTGVVQRDVVDESKLDGLYDISLSWDASQGESSPNTGAGGSSDYRPSIFSALQQELGLKLVASKRTSPTLIVDHVEMPSSN